MPAELAAYITQYGYLAIFGLVFLQEIGIPNPVPNEIVLLFAGYLASVGTLSFLLIFLTVVGADFIGTSVLFFVFYFFGDYIFKHKPKWLPISKEKIQKMAQRLSNKGLWGVYVGRLLPYVRGYTSVAAGLLRIKPKVFLVAVFVSAITWSGGYVITGKWLGKYWNEFAQKISGIQSTAFIGLVILVCLYIIIRQIIRIKKRRKTGVE